MIIMSNQGRQLKKRIIGKDRDKEVTRTLEEVTSALHESKVFTHREVIRSVLDKPAGLNLRYYTLFSSWTKGSRYVISIRKAKTKENTYYIWHYYEPQPDLT